VNGAFAFRSQGRAIRAAASGASVTVETHCQYAHSIYVGTRLDTTCGIVTATLDGGAPVTLDGYYPAATTSRTRRLLFAGVAAGQHAAVISLSGNKNASSQGWYFYFDFLECAVASLVPDPASTTTAAAVATDFDTDNTFQLSPQRLVWNIRKLGLLGEIDHYCGVFWWKQAVASNPAYPTCTVTFPGSWNGQDVVWLHIGASAIGKTVFGGQDSSNTIARHFANFINAIYDGGWASATGSLRRSLLHLLIKPYGKPRNPPQRGGADPSAPRATDRLPRATADRPVGHRIEVGRKARRPRQLRHETVTPIGSRPDLPESPPAPTSPGTSASIAFASSPPCFSRPPAPKTP
jgi:hypothetical protein